MERRFPKQKLRPIPKSDKKGKHSPELLKNSEAEINETEYDFEVSDFDDDYDLDLSCFNDLENSVFKMPKKSNFLKTVKPYFVPRLNFDFLSTAPSSIASSPVLSDESSSC